ncbi:hypothetical protein GCM10010211_43620 [Streptomyces albospinus]|uniref:Uncharacterized protein n=1 Tax=Streptomyces albospinus TaxID=285515 RepID=A0ABQ2VBH5_9ACTN|nr:hypothetical protein GCM10010211_43620 [Streptomyces albospinus]
MRRLTATAPRSSRRPPGPRRTWRRPLRPEAIPSRTEDTKQKRQKASSLPRAGDEPTILKCTTSGLRGTISVRLEAGLLQIVGTSREWRQGAKGDSVLPPHPHPLACTY